MEKLKLEKAYKLCIEKLVREYRILGTINQELLDEIAKLQKAIRNYDILKEMVKQLAERSKMNNIINHDYKKGNLLEEIPIDLNKFKYIKLFPISNDYFTNLNINKIIKEHTNAAEFNQPMATKPEFNSTQYIEDLLAKMTSSQAAEFVQDIAAQQNDDYQPKNR